MHLTFENVRKNYGSKEALKGISFDLTEGIYGLLGPNGAGKSTLMNIITGNLSATSGRILADGIDICKAGRQFAERSAICRSSRRSIRDFQQNGSCSILHLFRRWIRKRIQNGSAVCWKKSDCIWKYLSISDHKRV
ncbi:MAG: ATP-binding cassette domain-containing protein [Lachnospiraceae bacterium]|nr:ATP-binding cassette domain-containing protein [Lachnospiraceae bacterium]